MSETTDKKENTTTEAVETTVDNSEVAAKTAVNTEDATDKETGSDSKTDDNGAKDSKPASRGRSGGFKKNKRFPKRKQRVKSEFDQKILDIRRVTRVSAGGRRFSFSVGVVIGNRRGKIGVGTGKAGDTSLAIDKAVKNAQNNTIDVRITKTSSIPHETKAKFNSAVVMLMPAPGRGIIAGSALRDIIELGGFKDVNGKILSGSKNKLNIAKATIKALSAFEKTVAADDKNLKPKEDPKKRAPRKDFKKFDRGDKKPFKKAPVKKDADKQDK
jgi:small subunit ribosomal protein S5